MVIAITGGYGFLGREIALQARRRGDDVVQMGHPHEDIPSPAFTRQLRRAQPDVLVHAAGPASVTLSMADPDADRAGSVDVLEAVLSETRALPRSPRIVLLSSAAVYGQPARLPVTEEDPLEPVSPYGHHRVACEELLRAHHSTTGSSIVALRVFSAYGEGLRRQLLWEIACRAAQGDEVTLGGTGEETRDFVHASDVGQAVLVAVDRADFADERLNVASGTETRIRDIAARLLISLDLDERTLVFSGQARPGDPKRWRADIGRLRELGYAPQVDLATGLERYAGWIRDSL